MYHFALVEQKVDQAVIKLLSLDEKCAPMVGLMDFAKKVEDLVRATSVLQATRRKDKTRTLQTTYAIGRIQQTDIEGLSRMRLSSRLLAVEYCSAGP